MEMENIEIIRMVEPAIDFNYDDAEKYLVEMTESFKDWVLKEEDLKFAKDTLAGLNKLSLNVEQFRKKNKKIMGLPIKSFEIKCKKLVQTIEDVYNPIKKQYDDFEEKRKCSRAEEVEEIVLKVREESKLPELYANQINYTKSHLNKTMTDTGIKNDLWEQAMKLVDVMHMNRIRRESIELLCNIAELENGLETKLDVEMFMDIDNDKIKQMVTDAGIRAKEKQEQLNQRTKIKITSMVAREVEEAVADITGIIDRITPLDNPDEDIMTVTLELQATKSQLTALKEYLNMNNIQYGRVL